MAKNITSDLEPILQKTERTYIRLAIKLFCGLIIFSALIWGSLEALRRVREHRALKQVRVSLANGDKRWAALSARRVLEFNPRNAEAGRALARISEEQGDISTVAWRQQVVEMEPNSAEDAIALAKAALRFNQLGTAERAIEPWRSKGAQLPALHEVAAQIAINRQDPVEARQHFEEAVRLDPSNKLYRLNLAVFQLQSQSAEERAAASLLLQNYMDHDENLRVQAGRALREYAVQMRDYPALLSIAELIHSYPESNFEDHIFYVQVLRRLEDAKFSAELTRLQEAAVSDPLKLYQAITWMRTEQLALLALDWVKRLPAGLTRQVPVVHAVATCYMALNDWSGLEQWCRKPEWNEMDFLRHACLARALREQTQQVEFRAEWAAALKAIGSDVQKIATLQEETARWGWTNESADLLWMLTKDQARQQAALATLYQHYSEAGATADLLRVATRLLDLRRDDLKLMNNFAQIALLLNLETSRAHDFAKRVYQQDPVNPLFASTYAYSLYTRGDFKQAVFVMQKLTDAQLRQPEIAAYHGIILTAAGEKEKAREFLKLGAEAKLLPEEKALLEKARTAVGD